MSLTSGRAESRAAPLAALAMAALVLALAVERPGSAVGPRNMAGLCEAIRRLPLQRAAREFVGAPTIKPSPMVVGSAPAPVLALTKAGEMEPAAWSLPRSGLINLPPPAVC